MASFFSSDSWNGYILRGHRPDSSSEIAELFILLHPFSPIFCAYFKRDYSARYPKQLLVPRFYYADNRSIPSFFFFFKPSIYPIFPRSYSLIYIWNPFMLIDTEFNDKFVKNVCHLYAGRPFFPLRSSDDFRFVDTLHRSCICLLHFSDPKQRRRHHSAWSPRSHPSPSNHTNGREFCWKWVAKHSLGITRKT